jgi:large subunit ribosomal protein L18
MRRIFFRRRREGKTDFKARKNLLMSGKARLVIRKTNKYLIAQIIKSDAAQDSVKIGVNSKKLTEMGWKGSFKNIPSAYLTGLLLGKKSIDAGIKEAILDMGLQRSTKGSKIYAVLKGCIDAGLSIAHSDEILPSEDRISGKHINEKITSEFEKLKKKILG